jgi:hypothetical protein
MAPPMVAVLSLWVPPSKSLFGIVPLPCDVPDSSSITLGQMAAQPGVWTVDFGTLNFLRSFTVSGTQITVTVTPTVTSTDTPTNIITNTLSSTVTDVITSVRTTTLPTKNAKTRTVTP